MLAGGEGERGVILILFSSKIGEIQYVTASLPPFCSSSQGSTWKAVTSITSRWRRARALGAESCLSSMATVHLAASDLLTFSWVFSHLVYLCFLTKKSRSPLWLTSALSHPTELPTSHSTLLPIPWLMLQHKLYCRVIFPFCSSGLLEVPALHPAAVTFFLESCQILRCNNNAQALRCPGQLNFQPSFAYSPWNPAFDSAAFHIDTGQNSRVLNGERQRHFPLCVALVHLTQLALSRLKHRKQKSELQPTHFHMVSRLLWWTISPNQ